MITIYEVCLLTARKRWDS